ncbi:MAG: DUF4388 domain-containing protein [Desulfobacterales bacterium]|nr:DUF4388 domain-containing protein [Desulfobacterales bacterium]
MLNLLVFTKSPPLKAALERILQGQGISLNTAATYQAAVNLMENTFISLLVADFNLSRRKAPDLLAYARDMYPDIRTVALSPASPATAGLSGDRTATYAGTSYDNRAFREVIDGQVRALSRGGTITGVSPPLFAQLLEMEARSCILRILEKKTKNRGILVFRSGRLVDARFNAFKAMDAACRILAWEEADILIENTEYPGRERIRAGLQAVVMKSAHLKDESGAPRPPAARVKEAAFTEKLQNHVRKEMGNRPGLTRVFPDPAMEELVSHCQALGPVFGLGSLKLGYRDDNAGIFIPGTPPTTLALHPQCPRDRMTRLVKAILDRL